MINPHRCAGLIIVWLCLLSADLDAQKAPDLIPQNNTLKDTARQTDLLDVYKSWFKLPPRRKIDHPEHRIYFTLMPLGNTPAGAGNALVTSTTANIYLGPKSTTFLSKANFAPYFTFKSRFGLPLRSSIWLKDNSWNVQGDIRFLVYPQYTWGLGTARTHNDRALIDYRYIRFYQAALKRINPHLFIGPGYDLDYHFHIKNDDTIDLKQFTGYADGLDRHSFSSGLTFNVLYDTRNKDISPFPGLFVNLVYRLNPAFLGNSRQWQSLFVDVRKYIPLNPARPNQQNTLAVWSFLWTGLTNGIPYLMLPSTGWDRYNRSARGFDQNRFRGKSLYYLETEYRRDLTKNGLFGFVVFSNINTVSGSGSMFTSWHPAAGTGLRIKFSKASNTNFDIDFAFSKGFRTLNFNFNEAF